MLGSTQCRMTTEARGCLGSSDSPNGARRLSMLSWLWCFVALDSLLLEVNNHFRLKWVLLLTYIHYMVVSQWLLRKSGNLGIQHGWSKCFRASCSCGGGWNRKRDEDEGTGTLGSLAFHGFDGHLQKENICFTNVYSALILGLTKTNLMLVFQEWIMEE